MAAVVSLWDGMVPTIKNVDASQSMYWQASNEQNATWYGYGHGQEVNTGQYTQGENSNDQGATSYGHGNGQAVNTGQYTQGENSDDQAATGYDYGHDYGYLPYTGIWFS
ncbi:Hypothetical predicted protein [Lecanosticta acicola]|uniref:Uncharacterized protein n=1 Tax=Lecanosticta acicola TaxID=111012 RepID=A0AAI8YZ59_9PEZI|nr:Hypothetical predicted protein [Lecanosticta acicola]